MSEPEEKKPENRDIEILRRRWDEVKRVGLTLPKTTDDKEIHELFLDLDQSSADIYVLVEDVLKDKWNTWMCTWNWTDGRRFKEWIQSLFKRKPESSETLLAYLQVCEDYEEIMVLVDAVRRKRLRAMENK